MGDEIVGNGRGRIPNLGRCNIFMKGVLLCVTNSGQKKDNIFHF